MSEPPMPEGSPQPEPPPLPAPLLTYAQTPATRPGLVTAIGIVSIILGCLSGITNLCGMLQPISLVMMRSISVPIPPPTTGRSATTAAATTTPAGPSTTATFGPFANVSLAPSIASAFLSMLNSALGVYLLAAGILLLRNRASSRRHHLRFARLKIPLAVITALAAGWMQYEIQSTVFANVPRPAGPGPAIGFSAFPLIITTVSGLLQLIFSLAYPVALLIVLSREKMKSYFATLPD